MRNSFLRTVILAVVIACVMGLAALWFVSGRLASAMSPPAKEAVPVPAYPGSRGFGYYPPRISGPPQLAATEDFVYVLMGDTLYQFKHVGLSGPSVGPSAKYTFELPTPELPPPTPFAKYPAPAPPE